FSTAFEIERCTDQPCDAAYLEYSTDNEQSWSRLGASGTGTNWYNDDRDQAWTGDASRWHVASVALPRAPQLKLRFVLKSDVGTNLDGIAIDDIHIFDLQQRIAVLSPGAQREARTVVSGSAWFYFLDQQEILAAIKPSGALAASVRADAFGHIALNDPVRRQYRAPRSWLVQQAGNSKTEADLRLFITEEEVRQVWSDTTCMSCSRPEDIYRSGVTAYTPADHSNEDSSLTNNRAGEAYTFLPYHTVQWVPYDNGYYVQFHAPALGEYWLNDGGITGNLPLNTEYVQLKATKMNEQDVRLSWKSLIDTAVKEYTLQRSTDSLDFSVLTAVPSRRSPGAQYTYTDVPGIAEGERVYYRLFCTASNGKTFYSNTERVDWTRADQLLHIFPIPSANGDLTLQWTGLIGATAELSLSDISGKTVMQTGLRSESWPNTHVLHLQHLARGTYYLRFYIGNAQYTEKVVFK
ncbi:MAG: T9SS type A sorting domain-containing protein, partial [Chitinophagaceae bacterium]|nr:T9SS type A sorting domain-containing protein [Chitinophagaceae bacterium]